MTEGVVTPKLELPTDRPPLYVSAGIVKTEPQINLYAGLGLAAQVIGSFSMEEHAPESYGRLFYYDDDNNAAYNAFQLRNPGRKAASEYLPEAIKTVRGAGQLAIISVTPLKHENPLVVVPDLVEWALLMGASGVEINTSCPNENSDELLCHDKGKTNEVIEATRQRVGTEPYITIKTSSLETPETEYYRIVPKIDGADTINGERVLSPVDPDTGEPAILVNGGYAGQSGPVIRDLARSNLADWTGHSDTSLVARYTKPLDIWSVGGVDSGYEAFYRVHNMGAFMVGGAQAFYKSAHPKVVAERWIREYEEAAAAAEAA